LEGEKRQLIKHDSLETVKITHGIIDARRIQVRFEWDSYLENISRSVIFPARDSSDGIREATKSDHMNSGEGFADVVIAGMGAHAASWGQYSLAKYRREMVRIGEMVCKGPFATSLVPSDVGRLKKRAVVWYGSPAWPRHKKAVENFRATNLRLSAFNSIAQRTLIEQCEHSHVQLRLVDFFHMTYGVPHLSKDGAHYDKSIVAPTIAASLAAALC
jgi:hypothetical protein